MPLTFPAHQALVLPIKLRWPDRTDATAMCVGAAAPDLLYPVAGIGSSGHTLAGVVLGAVPLTMLICWLLRWRCALGVFANLPDAGPFRIHSYRVITRRRPGVVTTLVGASIGALSHVVIDAFTHSGRWGSDLLGLDEVLFTAPIRGAMTGARVLQYLGHGLGSLIAVGLFLYIGRSRRLEQWYGDAAVTSARSFRLSASSRVQFWVVLVGVAVVVAGGLSAAGGSSTFSAIDGVVVGALAAGALPNRGAAATGS
jgi:hypothetical protein